MVDFIDAYSKKWDQYLKEFGEEDLDIYYTKEYCRLYENEISKAYLFIYKENGNIGIYPFLLNEIIGYPIYKGYFDVETPYGYGGPLVNVNSDEFNKNFDENFRKFCLDRNIIAEFIRFHPLMKNETIFKENIETIMNRDTVYIDLDKGIEKIWTEDISSKNRNMIRKAKKHGLEVRISENYEEFIKIYNETMEKVKADSYYFFDEKYYSNLLKNNNVKLFSVENNGNIIAAAIFMEYHKFIHYHLAGSKKESLSFAPNNILIWEVIKYACNNKFKFFHLGGGNTDSSENSLYKFKKCFSKDKSRFYIGKRIHNKEAYLNIMDEWKEKNNSEPKKLLGYRQM